MHCIFVEQSAVVASLVPIFVAALAIASFLNGFWMVSFICVSCEALELRVLTDSMYAVCRRLLHPSG